MCHLLGATNYMSEMGGSEIWQGKNKQSEFQSRVKTHEMVIVPTRSIRMSLSKSEAFTEVDNRMENICSAV
jgi:hypothetical protein